MHTEHVQTKREIAEILAAAGTRPVKRLGQHFLIDGNLMRRLVACAELDRSDRVLEVGGGTGGLTDLIAARVDRLFCVEIDRTLFAILEDRYREVAGVVLFQGDILESKHRLMPEVASEIRRCEGARTSSVKLVANLPYQVATPLVMNLLLDFPEVRRLCFTVQAEVGERIMAGPNCKAYGPLSIVAQTLCRVQAVARIPPEAFWPRPAVSSVMLRLDVVELPFEDRRDVRDFVALVHGAFEHRRKTLRSALGHGADEGQRDRICNCFDGTRRPESFSISNWMDIYKAARG